jgi:hypothetical protein
MGHAKKHSHAFYYGNRQEADMILHGGKCPASPEKKDLHVVICHCSQRRSGRGQCVTLPADRQLPTIVSLSSLTEILRWRSG